MKVLLEIDLKNRLTPEQFQKLDADATKAGRSIEDHAAILIQRNLRRSGSRKTARKKVA